MRAPRVAALLLAGGALVPVSAGAAPSSDWTGWRVGVNVTGDRQDVGASGTAEVAQVSNVFWPGRGLIIVPGTTVTFPADTFHQVSRSEKRNEGASFGG